MAKRNKTSKIGITKKRSKIKTLNERLPKDRGEWLELATKNTERAIENSYERDQYLAQQYARLKSELKQWKKGKGNE
jgi:hypothetical protein